LSNGMVRACRESDLEAVAAIYSHYVLSSTVTFELESPGLDYWRDRWRELTEAGLPFLVAELDGRVVGYAYCSCWRPRPGYRFTVEDSVYLEPGIGGRGFGTLLLTALVERCKSLGFRELIGIMALPGAEASVALHRKLGFVEVGRLIAVGFKFGRWLDTVVMQLHLARD